MSLPRRLRHHLPYMTFIFVLLACSAFFTYRVEGFRAKVSKARLEGVVSSGAEVQVVDIIDGDEIVVKTPEESGFVIRILGIKSFDPVAADPVVGAVGQQARQYLLDRLQGETAIIEFDEFAKDTRGRLLSYLKLGDIDVGEDMVARGLTLTYTRFPFSRSGRYLHKQADAEGDGRGLWSMPKAAQRARALMESWHAEREL